LCDGTNGTPDLRGRFIYGYGSGLGTTIGSKGGSETHTLTINEMPTHDHGMTTKGFYLSFSNGNGAIQTTSGNQMNMYSPSQGGGKPHNNMPPYCVFAYIMKL